MRPVIVIAKILSWLLGPMLLPTYGVVAALWLTTYSEIPLQSRLVVVAVTFAITCLIPAATVVLLHRGGYVTGLGLNKREERSIPYLVTLLCYGCEVLYLQRVGADRWLWMFMVAAACVIVVAALINLKWKISGHMAGIGGLTALLIRLLIDGIAIYNLIPWAMAAIVMCGVIGSCRILLDRHTLGQVTLGWLNGFLWVLLLV